MVRRAIPHGFMALMLLALSGCATSVVTETNLPENVVEIDGYPVKEATRVFDYGLSEVFDRALDEPDRDALQRGVLTALQRLDPGLDILSSPDDRLFVYHSGSLIADLPKPASDDTAAWAKTYTAIIVAARQVSQRFLTASSEHIYRVIFEATLRKLDPYSRYASRREARGNREARGGFTGVGLRYRNSDGVLRIISVIRHSPAAQAGLMAGDEIVSLNGQATEDLSLVDVTRVLRGPSGTSVQVGVLRDGSPLTVSLKRKLVVPDTVTAELSDGIGIIRLKSFNQQTANSVAEAYRELAADETNPMSGLILDLRGDPGGLLDQAVAVTDLFQPAGEIVATAGRHPESFQYYSATADDISGGLPIVLLVDGRTASAAEIVAASLLDTGRALAVGTASFGKGTVQTVVRLPNDGEITLTWSRFTTPAGYAIQDLGVMPTICVSGAHEPDVSALLEDLRGSSTALVAKAQQWRTISLDDAEGRQALRDQCPSELRRSLQIDVDIAKALLKQPTLYAGTVGLAGQVALEQGSSNNAPQ